MDSSIGQMRRWLSSGRANIDIAGHVTVRAASTARGARTSVAIDHRISCELPGYDGWRVTTKRTYLPATHFSSLAAHYLKTADHDRGRTIYCQDHSLEDEVLAAISYHVDERPSWPVFITMIGYRIDFKDNAELRRRTVVAAYLLKQYVHAISEQIGRGGDVHIELPPNAADRYARELGFTKAKRLRGLRASGTHMRQRPLR